MQDLKHKGEPCREQIAEASELADDCVEIEQPVAHDAQTEILQDPLETWLRSLDGGKGAMLCYLESLKEEFEHLEAIRASFLEVSINGSLIGHVDPSLWAAIGADKQGH